MGLLWWRKDKEKEPYARLIIEVRPEGTKILSGWKRPAELEQVASLANNFGIALTMLMHGRMTPFVQHAIAVAGTQDDDKRFAEAILTYINDGEKHFAMSDSKNENDDDGDDEVVVQAGEAFRRSQ